MCACLVQGPVRRPLWLQPSDQGREQEEEKIAKHFIGALKAMIRTLVFILSEMESFKGFVVRIT